MAFIERSKSRIKKTAAPKKSVETPDYGSAGAPIDRGHPFYFGFVGTLGALSAFVLMRALASASQVFVLILVALFLAMGLNPAVESIRRRGASRSQSVAIIFVGVIAFVGLFIAIIVPPLVSQTSHLITSAPTLLQDLKTNTFLSHFNEQYGIIDTAQKKLESITSDGTLLVSAFGGVIGVGKTVISGAFTGLTILILTLYFLTSLPTAISIALKIVPASRRERVTLLTDAVVSRVGAFVGSQLTVSFLAGVVLTVTAFVLGLPSPFAIGILVFICGLIPLVGHFIGSAIVTLIALTQSLLTAVIVLAIYIIYQQVENYIITPKIMKRSLSLPGAVTIISALIGTSLLGLVGGLLAVPVAASIILILEEVVYPRADLK
jgi:predicted PurR-regulated permease PerM